MESPWISVKDRYPIGEGMVDVWTYQILSGEPVYARRCNWVCEKSINPHRVVRWTAWGDDKTEIYVVTHWMPIPKGPNQ